MSVAVSVVAVPGIGLGLSGGVSYSLGLRSGLPPLPAPVAAVVAAAVVAVAVVAVAVAVVAKPGVGGRLGRGLGLGGRGGQGQQEERLGGREEGTVKAMFDLVYEYER